MRSLANARLRRSLGVLAAWIVIAGCGSLIAQVAGTSTPGATPREFTATPVPTITVTAASIQLPTPAPTATIEPTGTPRVPWLTGEIQVYPGPLHYEGDVLSFEAALENSARLDHPEGAEILIDGEAVPDTIVFLASSPLRRTVLVFRWAWDTTAQTGLHEITIRLAEGGSGDGRKLTTNVNILPASERPASENGNGWREIRTSCCRISYISGTAADRDITKIAEQATASVSAVEDRFGYRFNQVFPMTLIDNIWGNGAYASGEIVISYVDRAYVNLGLDTVLRHEATHYAARDLGGSPPTILVEGIATYVAGGHYKQEPIPERAAALDVLGWYIPLRDLADGFRDEQHEIAYLEAAGLVQYLVDTYGWDEFLRLYALADLTGSPAEQLDQGLQAIYDVGLDEIELSYQDWLGAHDPGSQVDDLRLTVTTYDTIRRYQELYAPYEESLPNASDASEENVTAEFVREPTAPENLALETMLIAAREALEAGQFGEAEDLLNAINATLDDADFTREPIADYLALVKAAGKAGYEAQRITITGDMAIVMGIRDWPTLDTLTFVHSGSNWTLP